jgi:hypothetical protein
VLMKGSITPCGPMRVDRRFRRTCCVNLGRKVGRQSTGCRVWYSRRQNSSEVHSSGRRLRRNFWYCCEAKYMKFNFLLCHCCFSLCVTSFLFSSLCFSVSFFVTFYLVCFWSHSTWLFNFFLFVFPYLSFFLCSFQLPFSLSLSFHLS